MAEEPREQQFYRGVASVPQRQHPVLPETGSFPVVAYPGTGEADPWERGGGYTGRAHPVPPAPVDGMPGRNGPARRPVVPPPGLIVRRRWRRLRAGAAWTWTGLLILLFCWGIWAVSLRGLDLISPMIALVVVLAVAGLLFVVSRLVGRAVLEQALGRERPTAWPSHMTVGSFLILASIGFLQQTQWIVDAWRWVGDLWPV